MFLRLLIDRPARRAESTATCLQVVKRIKETLDETD
jgi:hypothetical protein